MKVKTDFLSNDKGFTARGVVARVNRIGHYQDGPIMRKPVFKFLTLDCGDGHPSLAVEYVGQAPWVEQDGAKYLDMSNLKEGQIIVSPGFIYKKIEFSSALMTCHLNALKTYRRGDILIEEKSNDAPIDLGAINAPPGETLQ